MSSQPTTWPVAAPVVVAIDDSDTSRAALAWAAAYARNPQTELQAVHVLRCDFGDPVTWAAPGLLGRTAARHVGGCGRPRQAPAAGAVRRHRAGARLESPLPGRTCRPRDHRRRPPRRALLVVGTRQHRRLERLLVGSVSHDCLAHASCLIMAVPAPTTKTLSEPNAVPSPVSVLS